MAVGDITYEIATKNIVGKFHRVSGTLEADGTRRDFDLVPGGYIVDFSYDGEDDAGSLEVQRNKNTSGSANNGMVAIASNMGTRVDTYNFTIDYVDTVDTT